MTFCHSVKGCHIPPIFSLFLFLNQKSLILSFRRNSPLGKRREYNFGGLFLSFRFGQNVPEHELAKVVTEITVEKKQVALVKSHG